MRYFKRYWNEPRFGSGSEWGCSWWYFEADRAGVVSRQVEVYDAGPTLRYSTAQPTGEHGSLTDQPLDLNEFAAFEIPRANFEQVWCG